MRGKVDNFGKVPTFGTFLGILAPDSCERCGSDSPTAVVRADGFVLDGKYVLQPPRTYRSMVRMSDRLFRASWAQYRRYLVGSIDDPTDDSDVVSWLDSIAAEKVNNPRSVFWLRG